MNPCFKIIINKLITNYKDYVKRRSFKYFKKKNKQTGEFESIREAALVYSFESYISMVLQEVNGKNYFEPHTGLGRSDLIINVQGAEYVVETKIYRNPKRFFQGKDQLAYYCQSIGILEGIYLVFLPNTINHNDLQIKEGSDIIGSVTINTYLILYDEEKDF